MFALALAGAGFAGAGILAEATLPPAPWPFADATPPALAWKLDAARVAYGIAFAAGLTGLVFHRRLRAALPLTGLGALALAFAAAVGAVETLERSSLYRGLEIPGAYSAAEASLLAAWACALALLALAPAGLALYRLRGAAGPAPPE